VQFPKDIWQTATVLWSCTRTS